MQYFYAAEKSVFTSIPLPLSGSGDSNRNCDLKSTKLRWYGYPPLQQWMWKSVPRACDRRESSPITLTQAWYSSRSSCAFARLGLGAHTLFKQTESPYGVSKATTLSSTLFKKVYDGSQQCVRHFSLGCIHHDCDCILSKLLLERCG